MHSTRQVGSFKVNVFFCQLGSKRYKKEDGRVKQSIQKYFILVAMNFKKKNDKE